MDYFFLLYPHLLVMMSNLRSVSVMLSRALKKLMKNSLAKRRTLAPTTISKMAKRVSWSSESSLILVLSTVATRTRDRTMNPESTLVNADKPLK